MKNAVTWFLLSCKRYLYKPGFVLLLCLLPLGALLGEMSADPQEDKIDIAVYAEADGLAALVAGDLTRADGMFRFYRAASPEHLKEDVASRKAECGYVFPDNLEQIIAGGNYRRSIEVYRAPSTVTSSLSKEVVFSALMRRLARETLIEYVARDQELLSAKADPGEAAGLFDEYVSDGSTFSFEYRSLEGKDMALARDAKARDSDSMDFSPFPVRGLAAVCLFITGLYGAVVLSADEKKGVYLPLSYQEQTPCKLASLAAPVSLAALSGLSAVWAGGLARTLLYEVMAMLFYLLAVTLFSYLLKKVCRKPEVLCCLIPFFIIGSLVFCPVFLDVGRLIPPIKKAGLGFLPYYYLRLFR